MELAAGKIKFDMMLLNRLARKSSVDLFVRIVRAILAVLMVVMVVWMVKQVLTAILSASSQRTKLASDLEVVQNPTPENHTTGTGGIKPTVDIGGIFGPKAAKTPLPKPPDPKTPATPFLLIGTFISDNEPAYAIIEEKKKNVQDVFVLNDSVFGEAKLVTIKTDRVEINRNGQIEVLKLEDTPESAGSSRDAGIAVSGTDEFTVQETELNQALDNLPLLLTQARAVPYFKDGKSIGLRLFAIKTGSLFEKIGLKNGDILKSINSNSLGDLTQAVKLFETLKNERSLSLILERDKADREFKYQIR
jgi:type II secretion system protein C